MPKILVVFSIAFLIGLTPLRTLAEETTSTAEQVMAAQWMSRYPDGQFHEEKPVTRAELAAILTKVFRLEKRTTPTQSITVTDVPKSHWAYSAIQTVLEKDVMRGYREQAFFPNRTVTRAEGFAAIGQAYGVFSYQPQVVAEILAPYIDKQALPNWAKPAMATVIQEELINIHHPGDKPALLPQSPFTRGDVAYALSKVMDRDLQGKPSEETP